MARVLVVDDENNIRMMMRLALEHVGHVVATAADGQDGLDKFGDGSGWDLVVLDQRMPGLDGLAVLRQIRHQDPRAKVIMATAFGTVDLAVDAMKSGAKDFLRKPFTAEILRGAVSGALAEPTPARAGADPAEAGERPTFGLTTINGFRIEFRPLSGQHANRDLSFQFQVSRPDGVARGTTVSVTPVLAELIRAELDCDSPSRGSRFWQAVCEETLANYLYQNADFPPDDHLEVDEMTSGLRRYIHTIASPVLAEPAPP